MSAPSIEDQAREVARALPPLTDDQVVRVAALLATVRRSS